MDNFSDIALSEEKVKFRKRIASLRASMDLIKDKDGEYYEHHQHLINTFNEITSVIDAAIIESEGIGYGV